MLPRSAYPERITANAQLFDFKPTEAEMARSIEQDLDRPDLKQLSAAIVGPSGGDVPRHRSVREPAAVPSMLKSPDRLPP